MGGKSADALQRRSKPQKEVATPAEGPGAGPEVLELESESVSLDVMAGTVKRKSGTGFKYH